MPPMKKRRGNNPLETIPFTEVVKKASKVIIASKRQVERGKEPKSPTKDKWGFVPKTYTGFHDKIYPTALICTEIPLWHLHLVVIDLDIPEKDNDVAINVLKTYAIPLIERTYCNSTPSGGVHIYLLSKKKLSMQSPRASHNINIDYQANIKENNGKYVLADYIWVKDKKKPEYYRRMIESPKSVLVVDNADELLKRLMNDLEKNGHAKRRTETDISKIVAILKPHVKKGQRQHLSCAIAGFLKKQGYTEQIVSDIIREVFSDDEELSYRIRNVKLTFEKPDANIIGWNYLKTLLNKKEQNSINKIVLSAVDQEKMKIEVYLRQNKNPPVLLVSKYIRKFLNISTDPYTNKYYIQDEDGSFNEINDTDIMFFCNKHFGNDQINKKLCVKVFDYFTAPISKDYDLVEFDNGVLNTLTHEFFTDKKRLTDVPKLKVPFDWNEEAEGLEIERLVRKVLENPMYPEDMDLWFKAVGHAFMGDNELGKHTLVTGASGTGKSTLTKILERIFKVSHVPVQKIVVNERFTLYEMVGKDINIDDDINNGKLGGIGNLNTVTSGDGLSIEVKGESKFIFLDSKQIPRLFSNGNTLPEIKGEGLERRLLLIHADNKIKYDERDDKLAHKILSGKYDKQGMEWLVYKAINDYWSIGKTAITSEEKEKEMMIEQELKSNPLKVAIEELYTEDYENGGTIATSDVNHELKQWLHNAYGKRKISKEHEIMGIADMAKAMGNAGYMSKQKREVEEDEKEHTRMRYLDIRRLSDGEQRKLL